VRGTFDAAIVGQQVVGDGGVVNFQEEGELGCAGSRLAQQARQGSVDHLAVGCVGAEEGVSFGDEAALATHEHGVLAHDQGPGRESAGAAIVHR
jgi:hypothetical protein